jgi:CHAT domain-containing protein
MPRHRDSALPAAITEGRMVSDLFPGVVTWREGPRVTRQEILAELARCGRLHAGCHAISDPTHPSRSRILLPDHHQNPLTAADILRLRLPDAQFAFLSACETGITAPELADESIHLASALHVAGYRHVVATLWAVTDRPAALMSRAVWTALARSGDRSVPYALHAAVRRLRRRYPLHPWAWAAHIHVGP